MKVGRTSPNLDWGRIAEWTACIVEGDLAPIGKIFNQAGADAPEALWNPTADQMTAPPLRFLINHWHGLARGGVLPYLREIDPLALRPALGYLMLLDAVDGGLDFRYRLYGSIIAEISKLEMTGKLLSEHPASSYTTEFGIAASRAALCRRAALYTTRKPMMAEVTSQWQRVALPLVDDSGVAVRLLAGTVAIGLDGRMISG
ncbi:MAG: PAS domain-containing protein [Proteobacteria bacterium]|nr:PAS domain-containing protein [Pseudomonadota bacterium]MBI3495885.1 PAS domain-containing protein [Pseudomonadota bacterium]